MYDLVAGENTRLIIIVVGVMLVGMVIVGVFAAPRALLQRRLNRFFDGAGITSTQNVVRASGNAIVRHRPFVSRKVKTEWGYWFTLRPNPGRSILDISEQTEALADYLRVHEVRVLPSDRPGIARVEVYESDPMPTAFDLDHSHFVSSSDRVRIGFRDDSGVFDLGLGHTLIVGATGSGKGSVLWSYIMGAKSTVGENLLLFGWDPKRAEFASVENGFSRVAFDPDEGLSLLRDVVAMMRERQSLGLRSFQPSPSMPFVLLVIDEFNSIVSRADPKWRKEVHESLNAILSQGRSAGIYVLAAAQQPQKEVLGPYRSHFMNRLCLRVESTQEVDIVLGQGSAEAGAKAHLIPVATESNGYSSAGVGYARTDGEPVPVRFRVPRVTDEDIRAWIVSERRSAHG